MSMSIRGNDYVIESIIETGIALSNTVSTTLVMDRSLSVKTMSIIDSIRNGT